MAEAEYAAATDPVTGSAGNPTMTVNQVGLMNVIDVRVQFGGLAMAGNSFNIVAGVTPGTGKLIDYTVRDLAVAMVAARKGGKSRRDGCGVS